MSFVHRLDVIIIVIIRRLAAHISIKAVMNMINEQLEQEINDKRPEHWETIESSVIT